MSEAHLSSMWEQVSKTAHVAWKEQSRVGPSAPKRTNNCNGTPLPSTKVYKAWVLYIFLRCGSKSQKLLMLLEKNKAMWVLRPQSGQTVVVVHPCLQLRFIRHECCTSFFNVGVSLKNCSRHLKRIKPCESFGPKVDKQIVGRSSLTNR